MKTVITTIMFFIPLIAVALILQNVFAIEALTPAPQLELPAHIRNTETDESTSIILTIPITADVRKQLTSLMSPFA
jgi:hypothetical protein